MSRMHKSNKFINSLVVTSVHLPLQDIPIMMIVADVVSSFLKMAVFVNPSAFFNAATALAAPVYAPIYM